MQRMPHECAGHTQRWSAWYSHHRPSLGWRPSRLCPRPPERLHLLSRSRLQGVSFVGRQSNTYLQGRRRWNQDLPRRTPVQLLRLSQRPKRRIARNAEALHLIKPGINARLFPAAVSLQSAPADRTSASSSTAQSGSNASGFSFLGENAAKLVIFELRIRGRL